jgi:hypothetical protein
MNEINNTNFQLIYHKDGIDISPFDVAITNVAKNNDIYVICPYIGINYFNRITSIANSWKLITDVEEWILSHQDKKSRLEIINFIKQHKCKIHHIKNVHAKVILTKQQAIIGSANFTDTSIRNKIEVSILIQDKKLNAELNEWFDNIWGKSKDISIEELEKYYSSIKTIYQNNSISDKTYSLSSPKSIKTKLVNLSLDNLKVPINSDDHEVEERLIKILKYYPNKEWIDRYFDLVKIMIDKFEIKNSDVRISMVIPKSGIRLPVNVGQRWVIRPYVNGEIGMIMPLEYKEINFKKDGATEESGYFYTNKKQVARWIHFERKDRLLFSDEILKYWLDAVDKELKRTIISGRRFAHQSLFFELTTNLEYRKEILKKAFNS